MHKYRFTCFLTIQHLSTNLFLLVYGAQRYFNFQNIKMAGITDFKDASSLIECAMVMQNSCCLITYERAKSICMCGPGCFVPFVKSNGSVTLQKSSGKVFFNVHVDHNICLNLYIVFLPSEMYYKYM